MSKNNVERDNLFTAPSIVADPEDCLFYHTMDIPGYGTFPGYWDIRGSESQYLGDVEFRNKRVLEIGPASGLLSFFMEREGAEVVSLEAAEDYEWEFYWDLKDAAPADLKARLETHREMMRRLKNSYWFCHRILSSKARVHYGSAYDVPQALEADISVLACILLHNKNPMRILENCARATGETIIIVEVSRERPLPLPTLEFLPNDYRQGWHTWWGFSPNLLINVLGSMGFAHSKVTFHTQQCFGEPAELFTLVASRNAFKDDKSFDNEETVNVRLRCPVERLRIAAGELTTLPLSVTNLGETPLSSIFKAPTFLSYHWKRQTKEIIIWDGLRTPFSRTIGAGESANMILNVQAPTEPGTYLLEITMLKEGVAWYDDMIDGSLPEIVTVVTP